MFSGYIYMHIYKAQKIFVANKNNFQSQQLKYLSVRLSHKANKVLLHFMFISFNMSIKIILICIARALILFIFYMKACLRVLLSFRINFPRKISSGSVILVSLVKIYIY
jgi:hypothetical protein